MRVWAAVIVAAALASCSAGSPAQPDADPAEPEATQRTPCRGPAASCTDIFFVAHEDDDLLFMNPDISNSIARGNHVVVVHLTAGDVSSHGRSRMPDQPGAQQYWVDRERGNINAYTFMAGGDAYTAYVAGNSISSDWSAAADSPSMTAITVAGMAMAEYDLVRGSQVISLVYMRLSDLQLEDAWLNNPGRGGMSGRDTAVALGAGEVQTVPCSGCPLATDIPQQVITRSQLLSVLSGIIVRFTAGSAYSSVAFQDASGIYIDGYGTPRSCYPRGKDRGAACGYYDYWDHVYGAMFVLSAALAVESAGSAALSLRAYRGYSLSQEPPTLSVCPVGQPWCDSQTTAKTAIMAFYGLYDDGLVDHGARGFNITAPSFQEAISARKHQHYDPVTNRPATYESVDANDPFGWESRQLEVRSVVASGALRGRLKANGACLGAAQDTLMPVACADAPSWDLTAGGQLQLTGTDRCATVSTGGAAPPGNAEPVVLGPCASQAAGTAMVMFENDQIRTADAKCLSMTSAVASVACTSAHDVQPARYAHATGFPVVDQDWTIVFR